jgi:iron(III) transport system substrate-binding protein
MLSGQKGLEQQQAAKKVVPYFPNQSDRGTHMNISGGGILKYAPNPENTLKLLEFLLTEEAQSHIVKNTFEYPIIENVEPSEIIKSMGSFKQDLSTPVEDYARFQAVALELMLRAGWK